MVDTEVSKGDDTNSDEDMEEYTLFTKSFTGSTTYIEYWSFLDLNTYQNIRNGIILCNLCYL